jgi:hypothetical protein
MRNHTHTQYTTIFTWKPIVRENQKNIFIICLEELHSLESPTSFFFQLQLDVGFNPLVFQATT